METGRVNNEKFDFMLMEDVFAAQFSKDPIDGKTLLSAMLATLPVGAGFEEVSMWNQMSPLTIEQLEENFDSDASEAPMLDWSQLEYAEWSEKSSEQEGVYLRYYGTRQKDSKKFAGVRRTVFTSGQIREGSSEIE